RESQESVSEDILLFSHKLADLKKTSDSFKKYYETNPSYVVLLFCSLFIFKQTFAIPGSAVLVSTFEINFIASGKKLRISNDTV
ncbi:hypothetical protein B4U80_09401, partial [Leptotrombidium deliense]